VIISKFDNERQKPKAESQRQIQLQAKSSYK